jgi:NAD+ synthase (glutamine-hydrolysing)
LAYFPHGIFRITAAAPAVAVANPAANVAASIRQIDQSDADLILLPELGLTGYTCGDLFASDALLGGALQALQSITEHSKDHQSIVVVGLPLAVESALMNVAAVVSGGSVVGIVPKTFMPTYREFYELRHFQGARYTDPESVEINGSDVPFGTDLLFRWGEAVIGVEICEDLWTPIQPSAKAALAGANVLLNLSASNETIGKAAWRRDLVRSQSGRCIAAYAYASSGPGESSSDLVFGGHCMIGENGAILDESRRVGDGKEPTKIDETSVTCDVDLARLAHDRRVVGSFDDGREELQHDYRVFDAAPTGDQSRSHRKSLCRYVDAHPFVPSESVELDARCAEIFAIQTAGLTKRLSRLPEGMTCSIGVSGGLDSTLALLVAVRALDTLERSRSNILGITMPGFGTTEQTKTNADKLIEVMKITGQSIDIRPLCMETFRSISHQPLGIEIEENTTADQLQERLIKVADDASDLTFENVQARVRTMLLMSRGFVLGTGDMSEQALGWCTYNADHMSMYNVNTSIPKTLVRFLVRYAADHYYCGKVSKLLHEIAGTTISPELLPPAADGSIRQSTEATIGKYELHDFFLFHFVRNGSSRDKILFLASHAKFSEQYSKMEIAETLDVFVRRFFDNQFKRNCVPDGPKVGSVSLSPRGDWRMPSDADSDAF